MSKISCGIIKDLLPLYIDDICSEESRKMVEEHLQECADCRTHYEAMQMEVGQISINGREAEQTAETAERAVAEEEIRVLEKIRKKMTRKQLRQILSAVVITLCIVFVLVMSDMPGEGYPPVIDQRLNVEDVRVTELYELEDGSVYCSLESSRQFNVVAVSGGIQVPVEKENEPYAEGVSTVTLDYSWWENLFGNAASAKTTNLVFSASQKAVNEEGETIVHTNEKIYLTGKKDKKLTIWEKGQDIPKAPKDIEKKAKERFDQNKSEEDDIIWVNFETEE